MGLLRFLHDPRAKAESGGTRGHIRLIETILRLWMDAAAPDFLAADSFVKEFIDGDAALPWSCLWRTNNCEALASVETYTQCPNLHSRNSMRNSLIP